MRGVDYFVSGPYKTYVESDDTYIDYREESCKDRATGETITCIHVCQTMYLTPEQAVKATLGRGVCHDADTSCPDDFVCSECGARSFVYTNDTYTTILDDETTVLKSFKYCPNCGRRIVE